jgi:hypothetical protein
MRRVVIDTNCLLAILPSSLVSNDKHFKIIKEIDFPSITILKLQEFTKMLDL